VAAKAKSRQYPTAFKLKAIKRAEEGEGVLPVARKLGISRKLLHDWIKAWKAHGPAGLNRKRGPKPGPRELMPLKAELSALAQASARIAELERLVSRQQLDIDFFSKSFARLGAASSARQTRIRVIEVPSPSAAMPITPPTAAQLTTTNLR
jgi:transposase